jgi:hypothetical protein
MDADLFVRDAIDRGQHDGLAALSPLQGAVFLVSELEVLADMEGIDSFVERYGASGLATAAQLLDAAGANALAAELLKIASASASGPVDESILQTANDLVTERMGYDYAAIIDAVAKKLDSGVR